MRIIEQFVRGKRDDQATCEDRVVITDGFAAVFDGATDISGATFDSVSGGRFAVTVVGDALHDLPRDVDASTAVSTLSDALALALARADGSGQGRRPSTTAVVYSAARHEVWRVGDASLAIDGRALLGRMPVDAVTSAWRRVWTEALLISGTSQEELLATDPGFHAMWPLVQLQERLANSTGSRYSYGVINGTPVPREFVEVHDVASAREVTLASDGYPKLLPTLEATEAYLAFALRTDPLSLTLIESNRGVNPQWSSFDDRAYVRLAV